jgi:anti-sigma regulatory factor (Ser/Thr protein kinase)
MMAVGELALNRTYPAVPASVPAARAALAELALAAGASEDRLDGVRLAASEALTNAVQHAYPDGAGSIYVTGAVTSGELWVLIGDDGCGLRSRAESRGLGLGLVLIAQISDDFSIVTRSSGGTEVRMRFNLKPRAHHARGSVATAVRPACDRFSTTT